MNNPMHLGGERYTRAAAILEGAAGHSNAAAVRRTVNEELFSKNEQAEAHAKRIMENGCTHYIKGIKENILELIRLWLARPGENVFTLYGKMGCGKSFFSAMLYDAVRGDTENYSVVAFSSQQTYRDTTHVRAMLISVAHQLFNSINACTDYFAKVPLETESIPALTEQVLVSSLENAELSKPLLVIIDGLDEYPRGDCVEFLETLSRLRDRLNPRVKIYFSSRPEEYIMSEMFQDPVTGTYSIESNKDQSRLDCACFIRAKCMSAGIQMEEALQKQLIQKCGFSLKYLDCFFNDISCSEITVTRDFIESLPKGLSNYYNDQLKRYFGDGNMDFYQTRIVPLLELLCVVWRPVTVDEVCDILGWTPKEIQNIISRSGTLLWKNNTYVMLYQSESVKEFLIDDRCCPERYRINFENGNERILRRLEQMLEDEDDIEDNPYLFEYAADHLLDKDKISNANWITVLRLINTWCNKTDMIAKLPENIFKKPVKTILKFVNLLFTDGLIDPFLREHFCVRLVASSVEQNASKADKLLEVFEMLEGAEEFSFWIQYGRSRIHRARNEYSQAEQILLASPVQAGTDQVSIYRHNLYLDELCRVYRRKQDVDWLAVTRLHIEAVCEFERLHKKTGNPTSASYQISMTNLSVSYDQLGRLCEVMEKETDEQLRKTCAQELCAALEQPVCDGAQPGAFLTLAAASYEKCLKLTKLSQRFDFRSERRIYNLYFSFYALGRLYSTKSFPGYNLEKASVYLDDCLASIMPIVERPGCPERYIEVPIKIYKLLMSASQEAGNYTGARRALAQEAALRDKLVLRNPCLDTEFDRCYCYEQEAKLVLEEQGIHAAEPYYLKAVANYRQCAEKYPDERIQRAAYVVYYNMWSHFDKTDDKAKQLQYLELTVQETKMLYERFPESTYKWSLAVYQLYMAVLLAEMDFEGNFDRCMGLRLESLQLRKEIAESKPTDIKAQEALLLPYADIAEGYCKHDDLATAFYYFKECIDASLLVLQRGHSTIPRLYNPLKLFLDGEKLLRSAGQLEKWLQTLLPYMEVADQSCTDHHYRLLRCLVTECQAQLALSEEGMEASAPLYYSFFEKTAAHAITTAYDKLIRYAVQNYSRFLLQWVKEGNVEEAIPGVQLIIAMVSQYGQTCTASKELQDQCTTLYLTAADVIRKSGHESSLSVVIELYVLAAARYNALYSANGDKKALQEKIRILGKLAAMADRQEQLLQQAEDNREKRLRLELLIKIYSFCTAQPSDNAGQKLAQYEKMLSQLPAED